MFLLVTDEALIMFGSRCQEKKREKRKKSHFGLCPKILSLWWCSWGVWETTSYPSIELRLFVLVTDAPGFVSVGLYKNHRALVTMLDSVLCLLTSVMVDAKSIFGLGS